jgi:Kef-type K+ transport system membrane component KefB
LGAAVLDDILGLILLAVVSGVIVIGELSMMVVAKVLAQTALFFLLAYFGSPLFVRGMKALMRHTEPAEIKIMVSVVFAMVLAWAAKVLGLATIIGAFTAGTLLHERNFNDLGSDHEQRCTVRDLISPLKTTLAPLFFVFMGFQVKLEAFLEDGALIMALALTCVAMMGKLFAGFGARRGLNRLAIGLAMMPRGEVGLIFASVGKGLGVVPDTLFSAIVIMVVVTTLITPVLLERVIGTQASAAHHQ